MITSDFPSATRHTVVVCGSLHFDVVVDAPHLPRHDETVVGAGVNYLCGGKGGNQAVAAALNGAPTAFLGCIGDDEPGCKLAEHLQQNGIDCSGLQKIKGASGMSVAIIDGNGDYGAVIVSASNLKINCDSIELPESTAMLMLQNEIPENVNLTLAKHANTRNTLVMLNAAPYRAIPAKLENLIDILILNRVEAEQFFSTDLTNTADVEAALQNTVTSIDTIIVTLGGNGLVYRNNTGQVQQRSAYPVRVSSSHGAGDMFCGALAYRIVDGAILDEALSYAMATAAWHVSASLEERSALNLDAINRLMVEDTSAKSE